MNKPFTAAVLIRAIGGSFAMLDPRKQVSNPVIFATYLGAALTSCFVIVHYSVYDLLITVWLWFTVLFANFSTALAESRGRAQALSLRQTQRAGSARRMRGGSEESVPLSALQKGDRVLCLAGDLIPADGEVVEGIAMVDESAITGESAPVIRESGGDRSAVTAGTCVVSDRLVIEVTSEQGTSFLDRMIALVEGAKRQKSPSEIALSIVLSGLTLIFLLTVCSLKFFVDYSHQNVALSNLVALFVCLIPTTIGGLLNAVGIAGMDRLIQRNVVAKSGRAVEAAGDVDLLILDKTGTITLGSRRATAFVPAPGVAPEECAQLAQLASLSDETPEGRSIVVLAKTQHQCRTIPWDTHLSRFVPFSAETRMSGIDLLDAQGKVVRSIRKGAVDAIDAYVGGRFPTECRSEAERIAQQGSTVLGICDGTRVVGIIQLKDVVKGGIRQRFATLSQMGIRTLMVTGDNPLTAAAIAAEAGIDDFLAEATPEKKLERIRWEQERGHRVAMAGDGTNDAPALAQADVAVAMNTGTQASREAGNMVDLDSNPTKLLDIIEIGKQMLVTRGTLTTFSIANDVAKYFAILPAIFAQLYLMDGMMQGPLALLNVMHLHTPQSAILSAIIFNALIIVVLIPLALKGVRYRAQTPHRMLRHNLLVYGLGGVIVPFAGIKVIDLILQALRFV